LILFIFSHFCEIEKNALRTHGPTDRPTDGRTDKPSYRDAWTHLKRSLFGFDWSLLIFLLLFAFLQSVAVAVVVVVIDVGKKQEGRLAENPGLETLDGKVDVVARGVERDLPLQR